MTKSPQLGLTFSLCGAYLLSYNKTKNHGQTIQKFGIRQ